MSTSPPPKSASPVAASAAAAAAAAPSATLASTKATAENASTSSSTSTPAAETPAAPAPTQSTTVADPKVAELQLMFPTVDVAVIEMILESVGGSQDRAIEQLLSMTDPEFQPDERHARTEEESQLDLDAQFARSLAMQDEQDMLRRQQHQQLPYQPRVRRARPVPAQDVYSSEGQRTGQWGPDTGYGAGMIAVEDRLQHFADAGKQTFSTLFNRAKAKYNEFQTQNVQGSTQGYAGASAAGGASGTPSPTPGGGRGGEQNRRWGDDASSLSSQSTIDPGPTILSPTSASNPPARQTQRWQPSDAYEDSVNDSTPPGSTINVNKREPIKREGATSPEKGKIDIAKLGILPKKRVDLLSTSPPVSTPKAKAPANGAEEVSDDEDPNPSLPSAHKSIVEQIPKTPVKENPNPYTLGDSDDELEYTKNPFDEK